MLKANFMNYFKEGKCYQWDKNNNIFIITPTELDVSLEFCLDQKTMETFLKFKNPKLKLGKTLQVQEGNLKASLKICDTVLMIPNIEKDVTSKVNVEDLRTACRYIDVKAQKQVLQGVYLGRDIVCATDSFHAFKRSAESKASIIIPVEFISLLSGVEGDIELYSNKNNVLAQIEDSIIIGRLLDGNYPTLEKVYASLAKTKQVEFNVRELLDYLDFSTDKLQDYVVLSKNKLEIVGAIPFEAEIEGFDLDCTFNIAVEHLKTALKDIKEDKATLKYEGPIRPLFINDDFLILPFKRD